VVLRPEESDHRLPADHPFLDEDCQSPVGRPFQGVADRSPDANPEVRSEQNVWDASACVQARRQGRRDRLAYSRGWLDEGYSQDRRRVPKDEDRGRRSAGHAASQRRRDHSDEAAIRDRSTADKKKPMEEA
jgi:hypothetical protein